MNDCRDEKGREAAGGGWRAYSNGETPRAAQPRTAIVKRGESEPRLTPLADSSASTARPIARGRQSRLRRKARN